MAKGLINIVRCETCEQRSDSTYEDAGGDTSTVESKCPKPSSPSFTMVADDAARYALQSGQCPAHEAEVVYELDHLRFCILEDIASGRGILMTWHLPVHL